MNDQRADPAVVGPGSRTPPSGRPSTRIIVGVAAGILGVVVLGGYLGLLFLGGQVAAILRGTVEFGTAGSGCLVTERISTFQPSDDIYIVAHLEREVAAGDVMSLRVTLDGMRPETLEQAVDRDTDCLTTELAASGLQPGHYRLEYLVGAERLAVGEFDLAP